MLANLLTRIFALLGVFNFVRLLIVYKQNQYMKKCPQCNKVFEDSLSFCTHDGTPLIAENFAPPSEFADNDEEETVIHHEPIVIDFSTPQPPIAEAIHQTPPPVVAPIVIEKRRNIGKYLIFLILGLFLGGGLVLAALLLAQRIFQGNNPQTGGGTNVNSANTANRPPKTPATPTPFPMKSEHLTRTSDDEDEFNGRVIALSAFVRSAPSKDAPQSDLLPQDDRLNIERRASANSPWYYISCEHGTKGWMHGDTIEFTTDAF